MINIKDLYSVFKEAGKIDEYQKILDLIDDSFKNREKIDELKKEVKKLEIENEKLLEKKVLINDLEFKDNAFWKKSDDDGPFCTRCFDKNRELIRLLLDQGCYSECPECKNSFNLRGKEDNGGVILAKHENFDPYS
ncbi:MAG: hypothetical protein KAI71_06640 [Candidatus Pacebacteria bacterium]|nr:hypothetical protein [Candidatus Paceibacterota bacterium]